MKALQYLNKIMASLWDLNGTPTFLDIKQTVTWLKNYVFCWKPSASKILFYKLTRNEHFLRVQKTTMEIVDINMIHIFMYKKGIQSSYSSKPNMMNTIFFTPLISTTRGQSEFLMIKHKRMDLEYTLDLNEYPIFVCYCSV